MVVPVSEEEKQPAGTQASSSNMTDSDSDMSEFPRKKKMFSSSSFYEEPNAIYPTVEEQVEMCRKIADSLSDDCNKKSRGANMFFKRVKRAEKWVVESSALYDNEVQMDANLTSDLSKMPYVRVSKDPPKLKLILDPRHIVDMKWLKQEGINIVEHNAVSPEICHDLVKDLNSPTGKGAQLFAKRKKKSEEWVVDEEKVKALLRERQDRHDYQSPEPTLPIKPLTHPRVQMIKTPWNAAMESPIGSCDGAFRAVVNSEEVADSVIRAAEAKVMTYPSPRLSVLETVASQNEYFTTDQSSSSSYKTASRLTSGPSTVSSPYGFNTDIYLPRAPRGWTGFSSTTVSTPFVSDSKSFQKDDSSVLSSASSAPPSSTISQNFPMSRTLSFADFNTKPKAWSPDVKIQQKQVKPVRPPSVLVQ